MNAISSFPPHDAPTDGGRKSRPPSVVVGQSYSDRPIAFGLDLPLELRGGAAAASPTLMLDLSLDWAPDFVRTVTEALESGRASSLNHLRLPPLALTGKRGVGRTHLCRTLARAAGVPLVNLDVSDPRFGPQFGRRGRGPDVSVPSTVTLAMASSRCANPIVKVSGIEGAPEETLDGLARMIDPKVNRRYVEADIDATVDLSHVNWVLAYDNPDILPRRVRDAVRPVHLAEATCPTRVVSIIMEAAADRDVGQLDPATAMDLFQQLAFEGLQTAGALYAEACARLSGFPLPF